ncbi:MAG: stalk domain-containing protein [bacterium]
MKKTALCLVFLMVMALRGSLSVTAQGEFTRVYVNGVIVDVFPVVREGIVYLPPYVMAKSLGASIRYDYNLKILAINDIIIPFYTPPDGRTLVPVEELCQAIGCTVEWDGRTRAIRISTFPPEVKPSPKPTENPYDKQSVPLPTSTPSFFPSETPMPTPFNPGSDIFMPVTVSNGIFSVTVSDMKTVNAIKDYYKPKTGYKFVTVYLSQQNVSNEVQIYSGRFSMIDKKNATYDYAEQLSNFWLIILRPGGINFGYLVFEVPQDARPVRLLLQAKAPLNINLTGER